MGVLAEVMRYKERKDAEQAQAANAIPQAVQAFIQGRQQQVENQNSMLKNQIDAAKAGFRIENGGLVQDPTLMDAAQKNVLTIDDQGNLKVAGQVGKRDVVKQLPQSVDQIAEKAKARGDVQKSYFQEGEVTDIRNLYDLITNHSTMRKDLSELGIELGKGGEIEEETIDSPFGPISLPARFNLASQYMKDPKYTAAKNKMERVFQSYRKVVTGAQASDRELRMLRPLVASFKDRPEVFFANLANMEEEADTLLASRFDMYDAFGRDTTKLRELYTPGRKPEATTKSEKKIPMPSKSKAPKGAKGWDTEKGEWVF